MVFKWRCPPISIKRCSPHQEQDINVREHKRKRSDNVDERERKYKRDNSLEKRIREWVLEQDGQSDSDVDVE